MKRFAQKFRAVRRVAAVAITAAALLTGCGRKDEPQPSGETVTAKNLYVRELGPVSVAIDITPPEPTFADRFRLTIAVVAEKDIALEMPGFGQGLAEFEIIDHREPSPEIDASRTVRRTVYELETLAGGAFRVGPMTVKFFDRRPESGDRDKAYELVTEPFDIRIAEYEDRAGLSVLRGIKGPEKIRTALSDPTWWIAGGAFAVIALAATLVFLAARRKKTRAEKICTPREKALAALDRLIEKDLIAMGLIKEFYFELTMIVRVYVEEDTGLRAPERTTEEFLSELSTANVFPPAQKNAFREFLTASDMVKYAGHEPRPEEIRDALERARAFVNTPGETEGRTP